MFFPAGTLLEELIALRVFSLIVRYSGLNLLISLTVGSRGYGIDVFFLCKCTHHSSIVLAGGFSESHNADLHGDFPSDKLPFNDQYDYWEDSDLEDELENDGEEVDKENASAQLSKDDSESSEDQPASVKVRCE